ncbi:MmcQ/YjbR family DNA-binding protein [Mycobacterium sp. B14F4]|uniref:MmcQ/YjbR family DNA-binding protein n=1 Tax=Mycobacterium sp. B14F4 TaxID=3153565 RepID=UPI00325D9D9F
MPHPVMFRDDDPVLGRVREIALAFPQAYEKVSHGRPAFFVTKMFVMYGGSVRPPAKGDYLQYPQSIVVKVDASDRAALAKDPRFFFPAYLGPSGWLGLDLGARRTGDRDVDRDVDWDVDWDEVGELVDASFRLTAPKKLISQLDQV